MGHPMRDGMAAIFAEVGRRQAELQASMAQAQAVSGTATVHKGMLTVTVGSQGKVQEVKFDNRNYRSMEPKELSRIVQEAIQQAQADALAQVKEVMAPHALPGMSVDDMMSGDVDLAKLMPTELPTTAEEILRNLSRG